MGASGAGSLEHAKDKKPSPRQSAYFNYLRLHFALNADVLSFMDL
jgi:hypothetical protein